MGRLDLLFQDVRDWSQDTCQERDETRGELGQGVSEELGGAGAVFGE